MTKGHYKSYQKQCSIHSLLLLRMNWKNFLAYLNERFPLVNMALFAVLFLTVFSVARFYQSPFDATVLGWREAWGMVAVISFFFRLRVFDEIKDYALDSINHPHRVLQSGRIRLGQLTRVAWLGTLVELAWAITMGVPTLLSWLLAVGYSLLMRYEFFASTYLKPRLLLYAFSHMLIMPLVIGWIWSAYVPNGDPAKPLLLLSVLSLLGGFSFEIARKLHAPEAERELVDSYSKSMGYATAIGAVLLILLVSVAVQNYLLVTLRAGALPFWIIGLLYGLTLTVYSIALNRPREKFLKMAELLVSLFMVVSYLSIISVVTF